MHLLPASAHVFTALGAVCALLAGLALVRGAWEAMFVWLGAALVIDAVDGTLARWVRVAERLPRFSGERLDLVIDFVAYVFVPALALVHGGYLEGRRGILLASGILLSSLFHFSDVESKDHDHSFVGFPGIWNVVAFYIFAWHASPAVAEAITLLCIALTFVPWRWVHPLRVERLRPVTLAATVLWAAAAIATVATGFPAAPELKFALVVAGVYFVGLALLWRKLRSG